MAIVRKQVEAMLNSATLWPDKKWWIDRDAAVELLASWLALDLEAAPADPGELFRRLESLLGRATAMVAQRDGLSTEQARLQARLPVLLGVVGAVAWQTCNEFDGQEVRAAVEGAAKGRGVEIVGAVASMATFHGEMTRPKAEPQEEAEGGEGETVH